MKISVVMSTFNGEKFIEEQMKSILEQTKCADEIVVFDDNSSDRSFEIVKNFSKWYPHVSFIIRKNEKNLGWRINFKDAILAASGDLIFCADQDDIWFPNKLEKMSAIMKNHPDIEVLGADFNRIDQNGKIISSRFLHERDGLNCKLKKVDFDKRFMVTKSPGCNLCFTKQIQGLFNSTCWAEFLPHDEFIWVMGELRNTAWITSEVYMSHREHGNNVSVKSGLSATERANALAKLRESAEHYCEVAKNDNLGLPESRKIMVEFSKHLNERNSFIIHPTFETFFELIKRVNYYYNMKSFVCDIVQGFGILK